MATLSEVILKLSKEPKELDSFKQDPDTYLNTAGLSDADKKILSSGDPKQIRDALNAQQPSASAEYEWVIVLVNVTTQVKTPLTEEA
jgi:hypothetical protein